MNVTLHDVNHVPASARVHKAASYSRKGRFRYSHPAPSADALPATVYGHSTWRPLSRAEGWRLARNYVELWTFHTGDVPKSAYCNRIVPSQFHCSSRAIHMLSRSYAVSSASSHVKSIPRKKLLSRALTSALKAGTL